MPLVKSYDREVSRRLHVLWSPQTGPIYAYEDATLAFAHATTMLGIHVSVCELRVDLPEVAKIDMATEYDGEEPTPVALEEIEDV